MIAETAVSITHHVMHSDWVNWIGAALQVAGMVVGAVVLFRLHTAVKGYPHPIVALLLGVRWKLRQFWQGVRRVILRRPPKGHVIGVGVAEELNLGGDVSVVITSAPMPEHLTAWERIQWLHARFVSLESRHNQLAAEHRDASARHDAAISRLDQTTDRKLNETRAAILDQFVKDVNWSLFALAFIAAGVIVSTWSTSIARLLFGTS